MLKVFRVHNDEYIVVTSQGATSGSLIKTIDHMAKLGIEDGEIETGLVALQTNDHHVAEYGVWKSFIYSKRVA